MNKILAIAIGLILAALAGLLWQQVRIMQRFDPTIAAGQRRDGSDSKPPPAERDFALVEKKLSNVIRRIDALEARAQQLETLLSSRPQSLQPPLREIDSLSPDSKGRGWGPEQVIGPPDTLQAGDIPTAWASRQPDAGAEWLKVDYEREVVVAEVRVRETHNPGAVIRVTAVLAGGEEALIWEGIEEPAKAPVDRSFPSPHPFKAKSLKIYLDTAKVPGWNEIDAVELIGTDGTRQWASNASASSSFASP